MGQGRASVRLRAMQYGVVAQLAVIGVINSMDRTTLSIANPLIRHDLGISLAQMGLLLSVFPLTYALAQLPLGVVIDRLGARLLLGSGLLVWSVAQALAGVVSSVPQLCAARLVLGLGEAPMLPCSVKAIRRWFSPRERGMPVGFLTSSLHVGQAIAAPILTVLMVAFGWRWMFAIMGATGAASAVVWFLTYRDTAEFDMSEADRAHLVAGETQRNVRQMTLALWGRLFAFRTSWGLFLGVFGSSYMAGMFATWLPAYMEMQHHLSIAKTGMIVTIPYVCAVIGSVFAGWSADWLGRRGFTPMNAGRIPFIIGLLGMASFTVLAALSQGLVMATIWLSCAMFFSQFSGSCSWIVASTAVPENCLGSFGGIQNCFGYIGATFAPAVTGFTVQATGSFTSALIIGAVISTVSAVIYWSVPNGPITSANLALADGTDFVSA